MISPVTPPVEPPPPSATRNACKLCAPLGACLAFRGVEGCVPFLHGSQGCATYIRRYMISHFREPLDIASSSFGEQSAIFGGKENLKVGLANVVRQYDPKIVGVATTCLAETIGDDVPMYLRQLAAELGDKMPLVVHVSTPSYAGTHAEGFHATVRALVESLAVEGPRHGAINLLPGMVSPADMRYLKSVLADFHLEGTLLPDYSDTLDGPSWREYERIPKGGTSIESIRRAGSARATIEFGSTFDGARSTGAFLLERFGVPHLSMPLPMGVTQTDRFFEALRDLTGKPMPAEHEAERGRLVDSYVDSHKRVFGRRAIVYGEQDMVVALTGLLAEIGVTPALCASGAKSGRLRQRINVVEPDLEGEICVLEGVDFAQIEEHAAKLHADLVIGSSKGYGLARRLSVPLVRVGFPIHDRIDGPRLLHLGYRGAQQLFDRIVNALIEREQDESPVGYAYM
jgi:nitrogenase molybdenum-iron protein NifN